MGDLDFLCQGPLIISIEVEQMIFIESKMRRKIFHPKTTTNGGHWSTGMGDINRSSPDGVRGLDDNYDKVEQEVPASHYLVRAVSCIRSGASKSHLPTVISEHV